jgi:hypothetical protein
LSARQNRSQAAHYGFDFGKFGHEIGRRANDRLATEEDKLPRPGDEPEDEARDACMPSDYGSGMPGVAMMPAMRRIS